MHGSRLIDILTSRLSNVFNLTPHTSPLRPQIYAVLIDIAAQQEEIEALQLATADVERWLDEWDIGTEEKSAFLKTLADASQRGGQG